MSKISHMKKNKKNKEERLRWVWMPKRGGVGVFIPCKNLGVSIGV